MSLFADLKISLASLTADGEEQGWQQLLIQKVQYLQNYDHGGDGGHGDDGVEDNLYIIGRFSFSVTKNDHFAQRSQIKFFSVGNFFF